MDPGTIVVLVMTLAWFAFVVYAEMNSRRNATKLKALSSAKAEPDQSPERPLETKGGQESKTAQSS